MQRQNFRCVHRLRVRWAEVDMQKIVFNAHYLMYIDTAMSDYWRALALPYEASMQTLGGEMYVKKATLEYHASAKLDDTLEVGLRCARIGNSSSLFEAGLFSGDKLLVSGELVYVFADPSTQTSTPVPPALRAMLEGFEAGADMVEARTGDWNALGRDAGRLRTAVFVREQGIAADVEADALDASAPSLIPADLRRSSDFLTHPVFDQMIVRHAKQCARRRSMRAVHQVTVNKAGECQGHKQGACDGIELPALRRDLATVVFERKAHGTHRKIQQHQLRQPNGQ